MATSPESLPRVARTALGAAGQRAVESGRPDRLFDDPYARAFVAAGAPSAGTPSSGAAKPDAALGALFYSHLIVRTRFYDEYLLAAGCGQEAARLGLAAGLDTRAFRLAWPDGGPAARTGPAGGAGFQGTGPGRGVHHPAV